MTSETFPMTRGKTLAFVAIVTFGLTALLAILQFEALVAFTFVLGFFLLLPLIALLGDDFPGVRSADADEADQRVPTDSDAENPVERLRNRYARGEIDEREFERRLERLLETEEVERQIDSGPPSRSDPELDLE